MYERLYGRNRDARKNPPADWQYRVERVMPIVYKTLTDEEKFLFDNWFKEDKMLWMDIATYLGVKRPRIDVLAKNIRTKFYAPIPAWMLLLPADETIDEKQYKKIEDGRMKLNLLGINTAEIKLLKTFKIKNIEQLKETPDDMLMMIKGVKEATIARYRKEIEYWDSLVDYILYALSHKYLPDEDPVTEDFDYVPDEGES